jgi:hypothetical protein
MDCKLAAMRAEFPPTSGRLDHFTSCRQVRGPLQTTLLMILHIVIVRAASTRDGLETLLGCQHFVELWGMNEPTLGYCCWRVDGGCYR